MPDCKGGARKGFGNMSSIAQALPDPEIQAAAAYFASLTVRPWVRVVETDTVPKTYVKPSNMRLPLPNGGSEPIGDHIVELPEDEAAAIARDPRSGFIAYVPPGSIAKGQVIVKIGGGETTACTVCHGPALNGIGATPPIAGRHTGYVVRQLDFFQNGSCPGPAEARCATSVQRLTADDMLV